MDQSGNKKSTHVPAEGFLFATQKSSGAPGAFVEFTHRNPHEVTETNKAVYDPLGNYMPFQASGDPRPPAGSFTSATMRGLSASQANPYSSAVGCLMDGLPATCVSVAKAIGRGEAKKLIIDGRGQNPNVALGNMGWFLVEFPTNRKIAPDRPRLRPYRSGPKPVIKDPYKIKLIDQEVNWAFRLISFQPQKSNDDEFTPEQLEQFKSCLSTMFKVYYKDHQYDRNGEAYFKGHSDTRGPSWYSVFAVGTFTVRTDQQSYSSSALKAKFGPLAGSRFGGGIVVGYTDKRSPYVNAIANDAGVVLKGREFLGL
ncbi:MAG TPA: hypothetical protein VFZ71_10315, partial [Pyrinomonadaceae bacterium]